MNNIDDKINSAETVKYTIFPFFSISFFNTNNKNWRSYKAKQQIIIKSTYIVNISSALNNDSRNELKFSSVNFLRIFGTHIKQLLKH